MLFGVEEPCEVGERIALGLSLVALKVLVEWVLWPFDLVVFGVVFVEVGELVEVRRQVRQVCRGQIEDEVLGWRFLGEEGIGQITRCGVVGLLLAELGAFIAPAKGFFLVDLHGSHTEDTWLRYIE